MSNRPQKFRMHEVRRGLLAAKAAGVDNPRIEIHAADGTRFVISGTGKPPAPDRPVQAGSRKTGVQK